VIPLNSTTARIANSVERGYIIAIFSTQRMVYCFLSVIFAERGKEINTGVSLGIRGNE
jgi:hypothetical protein